MPCLQAARCRASLRVGFAAKGWQHARWHANQSASAQHRPCSAWSALSQAACWRSASPSTAVPAARHQAPPVRWTQLRTIMLSHDGHDATWWSATQATSQVELGAWWQSSRCDCGAAIKQAKLSGHSRLGTPGGVQGPAPIKLAIHLQKPRTACRLHIMPGCQPLTCTSCPAMPCSCLAKSVAPSCGMGSTRLTYHVSSP